MSADLAPIASKQTIIGKITSIGTVDEQFKCTKCYSANVRRGDQTIKCLACYTRSLCIGSNVSQNKIKLDISDRCGETFQCISDVSNIRLLLEQLDRNELSAEDFIEEESVLLVLSSVTVSVTFSPKDKHINTIVIDNAENGLNKAT